MATTASGTAAWLALVQRPNLERPDPRVGLATAISNEGQGNSHERLSPRPSLDTASPSWPA